MLLWKDGRKVPLFDIWHLTIEAQGHYYSHVHRHQLNTTKMRPNSLDPFEEALKPPPGETPEAKEARLRQEEAAKTRSDQIDAAIHQEKLARKKKKVVRVSRITFKTCTYHKVANQGQIAVTRSIGIRSVTFQLGKLLKI